MNIFKYNELDSKKINYNSPEKQGVFYYSPINYNNQPFYLQTPKMICKNKLNELIEKKILNLDMEPMNMDFSFYDFLVNLDDRNIKETFKNNKDWFQKEIPLDQIQEGLKPYAAEQSVKLYGDEIETVYSNTKSGLTTPYTIIKPMIEKLLYHLYKH